MATKCRLSLFDRLLPKQRHANNAASKRTTVCQISHSRFSLKFSIVVLGLDRPLSIAIPDHRLAQDQTKHPLVHLYETSNSSISTQTHLVSAPLWYFDQPLGREE